MGGRVFIKSGGRAPLPTRYIYIYMYSCHIYSCYIVEGFTFNNFLSYIYSVHAYLYQIRVSNKIFMVNCENL